MKVSSFEAIATALNREGVRYLVAGGLAVNAHGYVRLTHDVDLVVQLDPENILPAFAALASLGYRPLIPVTAAQFADPAQRAAWIRDKDMTVLNFHSDRHRTATWTCSSATRSISTPSTPAHCRRSFRPGRSYALFRSRP